MVPADVNGETSADNQSPDGLLPDRLDGPAGLARARSPLTCCSSGP